MLDWDYCPVVSCECCRSAFILPDGAWRLARRVASLALCPDRTAVLQQRTTESLCRTVRSRSRNLSDQDRRESDQIEEACRGGSGGICAAPSRPDGTSISAVSSAIANQP